LDHHDRLLWGSRRSLEVLLEMFVLEREVSFGLRHDSPPVTSISAGG
jgi:hypothetical protein